MGDGKGDFEYSVWTTPEGEVGDHINSLIAELASKHNSVPFKSHVTIIGYLSGLESDLINKTDELAKSIGPISYSFAEISHSEKYTNAIYVNVDSDGQFQSALNKTAEIFDVDRPNVSPHLSLMYAELKEEQRLKIIENLDRRVFERFKGFDAHTIHLYKREWTGKEWTKVASFELKR